MNTPTLYQSSSSCIFLLILLFLTSSASSTTSQYFTDSDTYWQSVSSITPTRGSKYGGIKLHKSMIFEIKFLFHGKVKLKEWENIIRIGEYGNGNNTGCDEHGTRYPALFILESKPQLQISLSNHSDCWHVVEKYYPLTTDIIYHFIIDYNQTYVTISVSEINATNNQIIKPQHIISYSSRYNDDSLLGQFMDVIISDPLTVAANVTILHLNILSYDPTVAPTMDPTFTPSMYPTMEPTLDPIEDEIDDVMIGLEVAAVMEYGNNTNKSTTDELMREITEVIVNEYGNNTNKSTTDELMREITEVIVNEYVDKLKNSTNNTKIVVVITDIEAGEYDIILTSNYTTDNDTATHLKALFEDSLETEILEKISQTNASITVKDIDIQVTLIPISPNDQTQPISTTKDIQIPIDKPHKWHFTMFEWYIIIGASCICCILLNLSCFFAGYKLKAKRSGNLPSKQIKSKLERIDNHQSIHNEFHLNNRSLPKFDGDTDDDEDINIRNDGHLKQTESSKEDIDEDEYLEHEHLQNGKFHDHQHHHHRHGYHVDDASEITEHIREDTILTDPGDAHEIRDVIRNTILEVIGTPSGIQPIDVGSHIVNNHGSSGIAMNNMRLDQLQDMDEDIDDDIEEM